MTHSRYKLDGSGLRVLLEEQTSLISSDGVVDSKACNLRLQILTQLHRDPRLRAHVKEHAWMRYIGAKKVRLGPVWPVTPLTRQRSQG